MTNYRKIAIEVGDLLKWDVPLRTIGRMASAIFRFDRDSFPNESITSERAKAIWDWVLTLARQQMSSELRYEQLCEFCLGIAGDEHRDRVEGILLANDVRPSLVNRESLEALVGRNVQDGVKFLSAGLMRAIRNPTAHEPAVEWPISRADSPDILSFLSFLFRKLDDAVHHPS